MQIKNELRVRKCSKLRHREPSDVAKRAINLSVLANGGNQRHAGHYQKLISCGKSISCTVQLSACAINPLRGDKSSRKEIHWTAGIRVTTRHYLDLDETCVYLCPCFIFPAGFFREKLRIFPPVVWILDTPNLTGGRIHAVWKARVP